MSFLKTKKGVAILAAVAVVAASAVGAYAYFTASGSGSSTATVGAPSTWKVVVGPAVGAALTPGGPTDTFSYTVMNQNSGFQNLTGVTISVANSDGSTWVPTGINAGCSASDFSINGGSAGAPATDTSLGADLVGGATTAPGSISLQMVDSGNNQNDCKNASVPLYVVAA